MDASKGMAIAVSFISIRHAEDGRKCQGDRGCKRLLNFSPFQKSKPVVKAAATSSAGFLPLCTSALHRKIRMCLDPLSIPQSRGKKCVVGRGHA